MSTESDKTLFELTLGRSATGSICGIAAIVLAILGLAHLFPVILVAIATIVTGGSLLFKGAFISTEYSKLLAHLSGNTTDKVELGGGMSIEMLTGIAGIVLGILALLSIDTNTLVAIAIITFGCGVIMGSGVTSRLNSLKFEAAGTSGTLQHRIAHELVSATIGTQILAGIAAIVLGILSLIGFAPITLNLVAILVLGATSMLSGSAITGRMLGMARNT